jgi:hypothetical protein
MESSLFTLLPDAYEGLDALGVGPAGGCLTGIGNSELCRTGQNYDSCSTGGCYKG